MRKHVELTLMEERERKRERKREREKLKEE